MPPYIHAIGTASPKHGYQQESLIGSLCDSLRLPTAEARKTKAIIRYSGIKRRYSVLPSLEAPENLAKLANMTINERMAVYRHEAVPLSEKAVIDCLSVNATSPKDITHLITVSCTGLYAPGPDIALVGKLGFINSIERTAINFMGCYGGFNALKVASAICKSEPGAQVLVVSMELCTLHFQKAATIEELLPSLLFGDGAAAVLVNNDQSKGMYSLEGFHAGFFPEGTNDMTWDIGAFGFDMRLTQKVPAMLRNAVAPVVEKLMHKSNPGVGSPKFLAIHPGGKKILSAVEQALGASPEQNKAAHWVLENFGNMSSASIFFVLKQLAKDLTENSPQAVLAMAFGPGLTVESMMLKSVPATGTLFEETSKQTEAINFS